MTPAERAHTLDVLHMMLPIARRELPSQSQNHRTRAGRSAYRSASTAAVADLLQFDRANAGATMPLICFLLDDPLY